MKLKILLKGISSVEVKGSKEVEITGISSDSRTLAPGHLFIAKKGGAQFIEQAVASGAVAVLTDLFDPFLKIVQLITPDPSFLEAHLASRYYGHPSIDLFVVGVTGTKGKTTTTYLIRHLLEGLGKKSGLIGTIETIVGPRRFPSSLTTHDVIYNQKILKEMVDRGSDAAVLEVSSHGLAQNRVEEIDFDIGVFTNLYPDHLDYHETMEEYAAAKKKLLTKSGKVLVNLDSPWGEWMKQGKSGFTFGIEKLADIRGTILELDAKGSRFLVEFQGKKQEFQIPLLGAFNVYNALASIGTGLLLGEDLKNLSQILSTFTSVEGRLQLAGEKEGIQVFVDYAHTEEALDAALDTLRKFARRKIILVFGCGGNRDPRRRAGMARAAEKGADVIIVTNDNPRQEDPEEICRQIFLGFSNSSKIQVELDRKAAICQAIFLAEAEDIVLIAGKGSEKMQIFSSQTIPFDDVLIAQEMLHKRYSCR
jgi:UDP-N-acetylmuramoyl-L-alanyl-D-glutamate--2,6-diaminopimelate ligase